MPVLIALVWLGGAVLAVLAGFEPDPYLTHVRQMPAPHPYPTTALITALVLMTVHAGLQVAIWRSWRDVFSWRRAAIALCMSAAFLPIGALMALHAPPPISAYLLWLLVITAVVGLVALWRVACAAAAMLEKRQLSTED